MSTPARTRAEKQNYVNTLRLTDSQKIGFVNSGLNRNTIQKVLNSLKGTNERNTRINGILNALSQKPPNRGPLNSLLRQYNNRLAARTRPVPQNNQKTPTPRNNQNTPTPRNNQNTPTPTLRNVRPINDSNRNTLKRERPNKVNNINKIYKYPYLHSVVPKTKAQRNTNIASARSKFNARVGRSENAFNPTLISDETLNSFINLINDYTKFKTQLPKNFNIKPYEKLLKQYGLICSRVKRYTYSGLSKTQVSFLRGLQLICAGGSQANTPNENTAFNGLVENKDKVYDVLSLCSKDTFIGLSGQTTSEGSDTSVKSYIENLHKILSERLKDLDAVRAITFYLKHQATNNKNSRLRSFESYIATLGKTKNTIKLIPEELRKLIGSFKSTYATKRVHGLFLTLEAGPADHNSLSNRSLQNMVNNPNTFKAFKSKSLFSRFVWDAMTKHGSVRGACGFRGKIDDALLRRRVVFANVGESKTFGYRTFAEALVSMNHGRTHTLKTIVRDGNKTVGVPAKMKNYTNSKKYLNAMKNQLVRNDVMFLNTEKREPNHLYKLQVGNRTPLRFDGEKLVKFDPSKNLENPNVLWTTYGLHMNQTSKGINYNFFDLLKYLHGDKNDLVPRQNGRGIGKNYVIQLDSRTLTWLHDQYYFTDKLNEDYTTKIINKITSCSR